jgi:pantetheine-phosphate adenylyltransferase
MDKIVYAGTFDPMTNGHWWVIKEGLEMAKNVLVFVAENPNKKTVFTAQERKSMIEQVAKDNKVETRVSVHIIKNEYVALRALKMGASYMIRGIRNSIDFDYEAILQRANTDTLQGAKTVFVMPPRDLDSVSSSFVKSLVGPVGWHWNIKQFLPHAIYVQWLKRFISNVSNEFVKDKRKYPQYDEFLNNVFSFYGKEDRYYHNLEHVVHCIQELQWQYQNNNQDGLDYEQVFLAILGHDLIYKANEQKTDEELSSEKTLEILGKSASEASEIILSTQHLRDLGRSFSLEEKLMRSIDLAILAQPNKIYKQYTGNIRKEYSQYTDEDYLKGRQAVLEKFLKDENLFESEGFEEYTVAAKANIRKELAYLRKNKK